MQTLRRLGRFLRSMKFAVILLLLLAVACTIGSVLPQEQTESYYTASLPGWAAHAVLALGLNRLFTVWWFIALAAALCVNLMFCSISRFPKLLRQYRHDFGLDRRLEKQDASLCLDTEASFEEIAAAAGVRLAVKNGWRYGARCRFGLWGSWLCHLGMLIIIVGFATGQMLSLKTSVYGVPGTTHDIPGTDCTLTIDSFNIALREDETVEQYTAGLTITRGAEHVTGVAQVNAPMDAFGYRLYQNSTGWAADVTVLKGEQVQRQAVLCAGEFIAPADFPELVFGFYRFYPDYSNDGANGPMTLSASLNNPVALFMLYYQGNMVAMDTVGMGQRIEVDEYAFILSDPRPYTLIEITRDPAQGVTAFGGLLLLLALALAFYCKPEEIWACETAGKRRVCIHSAKPRELLLDRLSKLNGTLAPPRETKEDDDELPAD